MPYQYLALGDSYTIGEAVPLMDSFPYQTVQLLRSDKIEMAAPELIARTGWTTDELLAAMDRYTFQGPYDAVSLLIGVNNQYRGYSLDTYKREFEQLLQRAIQLAGQKPEKVFVLSIPDYSVTTFAQDKNPEKIAAELDAFNAANQAIADGLQVPYINITESSRQAKNNVHLLADDGLHPSAAAYHQWAMLLAQKMKTVLA